MKFLKRFGRAILIGSLVGIPLAGAIYFMIRLANRVVKHHPYLAAASVIIAMLAMVFVIGLVVFSFLRSWAEDIERQTEERVRAGRREIDYDKLSWSDVQRLSTDARDEGLFALIQYPNGDLLVREVVSGGTIVIGGGVSLTWPKIGNPLLVYSSGVPSVCVYEVGAFSIPQDLKTFGAYTRRETARYVVVRSIELLHKFHGVWNESGWVPSSERNIWVPATTSVEQEKLS